jgi:hypothetical protein
MALPAPYTPSAELINTVYPETMTQSRTPRSGENCLVYALYVNTGYLHRLAERWRANVHVLSGTELRPREVWLRLQLTVVVLLQDLIHRWSRTGTFWVSSPLLIKKGNR